MSDTVAPLLIPWMDGFNTAVFNRRYGLRRPITRITIIVIVLQRIPVTIVCYHMMKALHWLRIIALLSHLIQRILNPSRFLLLVAITVLVDSTIPIDRVIHFALIGDLFVHAIVRNNHIPRDPPFKLCLKKLSDVI